MKKHLFLILFLAFGLVLSVGLRADITIKNNTGEKIKVHWKTGNKVTVEMHRGPSMERDESKEIAINNNSQGILDGLKSGNTSVEIRANVLPGGTYRKIKVDGTLGAFFNGSTAMLPDGKTYVVTKGTEKIVGLKPENYDWTIYYFVKQP